MAESEDWLIVGKLVGAQGLQGELRVNPASDFPERFTTPGSRWLRTVSYTHLTLPTNSRV